MVKNNIVMEDARIGFRNFSGEESKFNKKGDKNFCAFIDDVDLAAQLEQDGWNIKYLNPREDDPDDIAQAYLPVAVSFDHIQPKIIMVTENSVGKKLTPLGPSTIMTLDWAEIVRVDLVIRPYNWEVNGKTGVKGYAKTMYVTIAVDDFNGRYDEPTACDIPQDK